MNSTNPKPSVLTLMPFNKDFKDIYQLGIKDACTEAGAYCERIDEQIFTENILERLYNQIAKADIIVADTTGRNPNVFYEVGYAHALNKTVILTTQKEEDIPFDLKHYPFIIYDNIVQLKTELKTKIQWCIEHKNNPLPITEANLKIFINDIPITDTPTIQTSIEQYSAWTSVRCSMRVAIQNISTKTITPESTAITLITSRNFDLSTSQTINYITNALPENASQHKFQLEEPIFPYDWLFMTITLRGTSGPITQAISSNAYFRIFTPLGKQDYPFTITIDPSRTQTKS